MSNQKQDLLEKARKSERGKERWPDVYWNNERIRVLVVENCRVDQGDKMAIPRQDAVDLLKRLRDDYEQRIADFAKELHRQTLLAAYRQQRIDTLEAENARLHALLEPDMIALARSLLANVPVYDDDLNERLDETMQIAAWLDRLEDGVRE